MQKDAREQLERAAEGARQKEHALQELRASVDGANAQLELQSRRIEALQEMREQLQHGLQQSQAAAAGNEKEMRKAEQLHKDLLRRQVRSALEGEFAAARLKSLGRLVGGSGAQ